MRFVLALLLNIVLGAQMYIYWGKDEEDDLGKVSTTAHYEKKVAIPEPISVPDDLPSSSVSLTARSTSGIEVSKHLLLQSSTTMETQTTSSMACFFTFCLDSFWPWMTFDSSLLLLN
ncbi:hypothetical protein QCA50_019768 [Cerrena zonata]|uniref:Uncharacterized protein n=1 Tax=Cerrena zonata TaxID=2478898 RepID=A0AAW0FDL3_9APHY